MSALTETGRFAPSPSGPLHFGSLMSGLASFLDIKQRGGQWLLRIEDIDPPREVQGASETILRQLDHHGLTWDGQVLYQSTRLDDYSEALHSLQKRGLIYHCRCTRQRVSALRGVYDGHCRHLRLGRTGNAARLSIDAISTGNHAAGTANPLSFNDHIMGYYPQDLNTEVGDFILRRRDGLFSYQLAAVVDDQYQGITHIMRGADLIDSTPRQIYLQQCLNFSQPQYAHLPLALNGEGQKLSKQHFAVAINAGTEVDNLWAALAWLQQSPPAELKRQTVREILDWGIHHWALEKVPANLTGITAPEGY